MLLSVRRSGAVLLGGAVALALATPHAAAAEPAAVTARVEIVQSLGADASGGITPHVFAKGSDGNVWVAVVDRDADDRPDVEWTKVGRPSGTTIDAAVGADSGGLDTPYLFVRTADGELWMATESGTGWTWTPHERPAGVWLQGGYGVVAPQYGGRPHVFVKGHDNNLWVRSWNGSTWTWTNAGRPAPGISAPGGAVVVEQTRPTVFAKGGDGDLWVVEPVAGRWRWTRQGRPAQAAIKAGYGAAALGRTTPVASVLDTDGVLWSRSWNGTTGTWKTLLGNPAAHSPVGVTSGGTANQLWTYFRTTKGEIRRSMSPSGGSASIANPAGIGFDAAYGAINFGYQSVLENMAFLKGSDDRLWILWSVTESADLRWIDAGSPRG
jgi:hypothetical protein